MNDINKSPYNKNRIDSKSIFFISLSIATIIIAFSFFYYNVIYKPQLEKNKIELLKIEQENKIKLQKIEQENAIENKTIIEKEITEIAEEYDICKKVVRINYELEWKGECKRLGLTESIETPLLISTGERFSKDMQERLDLCEREYKMKLEILKLKQK